MTYSPPRHCVLCGNPTSLCDCQPEVRAFADAHVTSWDNNGYAGLAVIQGATLRVLIERAQAWGRHQSKQALVPEELPRDAVRMLAEHHFGDGDELGIAARQILDSLRPQKSEGEI